MKNAINYYYNLNPYDIHQINKIYKFKILNNNYIVYPYNRKIEELDEIYELHIYLNLIGIYCHKIILNKDNQILTYINGIQYVLLQTNIENKNIKIQDITNLSNISIRELQYQKIKRKEWKKLWENKIDYIEYQISQFGKKYPLIRESSDYYIGIVENCIALLSNINNKNQQQAIQHDRINEKYTTEDFYNPLNFIIDNRIRDISEYIKSYLIEDIDIIPYIQNYIYTNRLTKDEILLLFIRIMYPSTYLDISELILNNKIKEKELLKVINNSEKYEKNIKRIYRYLRNITSIPEIEWLNQN